MSNSEICEKAAEYIRQYGWRQRSMGDRTIGFCLMGAAMQASIDTHEASIGAHVVVDGCNCFRCSVGASGRELAMKIVPAVPHAGRGTESHPFDIVTAYNDGVLETKDQAIDTLMSAAKYWRNKGD